ncbi:MAG TPA: type II toxin-antitoxin system RelE/ParE family toxin [Chitinophagaceae bacterium]
MAQLIWAPSALKDIDTIARYISKDSILAAENIVHLFFERAEILIKHPTFGKPVPEVNDSRFREIVISRYRIIYELISEQSVNIITVHHQSRLLKNNPTIKKQLK